VREFRKKWNGIPAALLFFVHNEATARKTYTALLGSGYIGMPRIHRLIEKPTWVPRDRPYGAIAGTGLAIVNKDVANECARYADRADWVDLFQLAAIDRGLPTFAVPFETDYFNVNRPEDLADLREFVARR
jgi:NDP-sugar pyrophosphorylase family protein